MFKSCVSRVGLVALFALVGCAGESSQDLGSAESAVRRFHVGDSFVYDIHSARSVSESRFSSKFDGVLAVTVVGEDRDGGFELRGDVRAPRYEQLPAADLSRELEKPFFFTVLPTGEMKSFRFSKGVSSSAAAVQRELALSLQLVEASEREASGSAWRSVERDGTGAFDAEYTRAGGAIHKSKLRYVSQNGGSAIPGMDDLSVQGSVDFTLDQNRWPRTMKEQESAKVTAGALVLTISKSASAKLVRVEQQPALVGSLAASDLVSDTAMDAEARAIAKLQADKNLVNGRSFAEIAAGLRASETKTRDLAQGRLAALIRLDPSAAKAARAEVRARDVDVNAQHRLVGALGAAGTKEAQHELVAMLDPQERASSPQLHVIMALALTKAPTAETAVAIKDAMASREATMVSAAVLASGAVVRAMIQSGSGDPTEALELLLDKLARAAEASEKALYLEALGNTGHARALAAIQPFLSDADTRLRASAARGMRFMEGSAADEAVIAALSDPELEVQQAAAHALQHRPMSAPVLAAIEGRLGANVDKSVRAAMVKGLKAREREIAWMRDHATTEQLAQTATRMLEVK